jgi:hypothetical protein
MGQIHGLGPLAESGKGDGGKQSGNMIGCLAPDGLGDAAAVEIA